MHQAFRRSERWYLVSNGGHLLSQYTRLARMPFEASPVTALRKRAG